MCEWFKVHALGQKYKEMSWAASSLSTDRITCRVVKSTAMELAARTIIVSFVDRLEIIH